MAVRQYIGARYVPRFLGTYDPTQIYEALDVVDNGSGTSYIARKTVPAGTPLTSTEHWFVYGASSGAIIALQNDMITAQNDIISLQGDVTTAQNDIDALEDADFIDKNILIISDSYGLNVNGSGKNMAEIANDFLPDYNISIEATSSGSFGGGVLLETGLNNYTGDKTKIGHIIIVAGANDVASSVSFNDIITGMQNFNSNARTNYPNADISLIACGTCYVASSVYSADQRLEMIEAYIAGANSLGWAFAENSQYLLHDTRLLQADLLHPSANGVDAIGRAIVQYIETGVVNFYHRLPHTSFAGSGANIASINVAFDELFINNDLIWYRNSANPMLSVAFTTPVAVGSNGLTDWINHGDMTARMVDTFSSGNKFLIVVPAQITHSDSTRTAGYVQYSIQFGKVYGRLVTPSNVSIASYQTMGDCVIVPKM